MNRCDQELVDLRRDLHAHPEIGLHTPRTSDRVASELLNAGADEVHIGIGSSGVVAVVHGRPESSRRAIGLRADMDALPIHEANGFAHRSVHDGRMHACGHDGHTAMLVGAVRALAAERNFEGTVVAIFQPGEEGHAGARNMVEDGLFDRFPVAAVYALHNWPTLRVGEVAVRPGPIMAARDDFWIRLSGPGGHGAQPHLCLDPLITAAHLIAAMQSVISRNVDPADAAVVTVHSIRGGNPIEFGEPATSVTIPVSVELAGTAKWVESVTGQMIARRISEIAQSTAAAFGVSVEVDYQHFLPLTSNDAHHAEVVAQVGTQLLGEGGVQRGLPPSMGSEDFSFLLANRPGAYFLLGAGQNAPLHSPTYDFNDDIIPIGIQMLVGIAQSAFCS